MKTSRYDTDSDSSAGGSMGHEQPQNDASSAGPESLRRLQRKLTTAMEHMERAQLEFFHVERAFENRKQQQQDQEQEDKLRDAQSVPWSVKVQLYCEFWQQFVEQLRSTLCAGGDDDCGDTEGNEQAIEALSMLASSVWGESRVFKRQIFRNGPIVLTPRLNVRVPKQRESRVSLMAFNGIGSHQIVSKWAPAAAKPAIQSLMTPRNAAAHRKIIATTGKVTDVDGHAAASHHRKKAKRSATNESSAVADTGACEKTTNGGSAIQRVESPAAGPDNGFQSIAAKPISAEELTRTKSTQLIPLRIRHASPDVPRSTDMIGFIERPLFDAGLSSNQQSLTEHSTTAPCPRPSHQHQQKKKLKNNTSLAVRKLVPVGLEDSDNDLRLVPIPETPSDFSKAIVQVKQEIAAAGCESSGRGLEKKIRGAFRYAFFEQLRERIQDLLGPNEVFPNLVIPFPREHLIFDPDEHPLLAEVHEKFWQSNLSAYLEIVFYHPTAEDLNRHGQHKTRLLRLQRALLGRYIETLGIYTVARKLLAQEASIPFFFVKSVITLNTLSSQSLDDHLACLKEPWKSPTTKSRVVSWWEALVSKKNGKFVKQHQVNFVNKHLEVDVSDATKQQIVSAHLIGDLDFDANWLRLSTQSPWKEMLDQQRGMRVAVSTPSYDDEHEHGLPQSPPHRKKVAGRVPTNRESLRTNGESAERVTWLQHLASLKASQGEDELLSSSSEDTDEDGDFGPKLGKRLRTN